MTYLQVGSEEFFGISWHREEILGLQIQNDGGVLRIGQTGSDEVKEIPPVKDGLRPHLPFHSRVEAVSAH